MSNLFFREKKNKNSGFTLVEMIVVLVILGILASAAVYSIIAYINLSRYRNNNENALSVYQSAQAAINHMENAGSSEEFAAKIFAINTKDPSNLHAVESPFNSSNSDGIDNIYNSTYFDAFPASIPDAAPGQSAHMRYAVTYTPGGNDDQSKLIYDLISADFNSTDLFSGIITIEFDIEKTLDNLGNVLYSVNVYSVFYDSGRKNWNDTVATNNGISGIVPYRNEDYRSGESFIGYCNGSSTPTAVDSVVLPDESEIKSTIFTLRNGETLDLTWSATAESLPVTGTGSNIHYVFSLYDYDIKGTVANNKICNLVVNECDVLDGTVNAAPAATDWYTLLRFEKATFVENQVKNVTVSSKNYPVVYTKETVKDRRGVLVNIYRATIRTSARVYVQRNTNQNALDNFNYDTLSYNNLTQTGKYYTFPLSISYEIHEGDGVADRISYTLTLDAMMSRNIYNTDENSAAGNRTLNYSFDRLCSDSKLSLDSIPKNFYAEMVIAPNHFTNLGAAFNDTTGFTQSDVFMAERALDDPVYLQPDGSYSYVAGKVFKENGKKFAIVNCYFGDLDNGSFGTNDKNSDTTVNAVITSYRHLSNIRMLRKHGKPIEYSICRDLNWYNFANGGLYSSEVIVYTAVSGATELTGHSPQHWPEASDIGTDFSYGKRLDVVSFPSIPYTSQYATIIAKDNTISQAAAGEDKTSVINNVQMRMPSFYDTDLKAYGLICTNNGTIINIRANGLTLLLDNLPDGSPDDREKIKTAVEQMRDPGHTVSSTANPTWQMSSPVGGLVGANSGIIGSQTETDINKNTLRFSNCIVMSGHWSGTEWVVFRVSAVGIIIGDNNGPQNDTTRSAYGLLETTGMFASTGYVDVSGVIGYSKASIDALIRVDNTKDTSKKIIEFKNNVSSLIFGTSDAIGGAIGSLENSAISQNVSAAPFTLAADALGRIQSTPGTNPVYAIDVKFDSNSYIICKTDDKPKINTTDSPTEIEKSRPSGFGGAIGRVTRYNGNILSIKVENDGRIISSEGTTYAKCLGGAIGIVFNGSIQNAYIKVINNGQIGTDTTYANSTGGAIGRINNFTGLLGTVNIDVVNNGQISGNSTLSNDCVGVGGAVGSVMFPGNSAQNMPAYRINSINNGTISGKTLTPGGNDGNNNFGVGGAVGQIKYIPVNSAIYCINTSGSSVSADGNNAGGCIGDFSNGLSRDPGSNNTTITADLQNGTSVTATGANAGGNTGNFGCAAANLKIRTIVSGTVSVTAASDAGGIAGRFKVIANNGSSDVSLLAQSPGAVIKIKAAASASADPAAGNDNAGGLFGLVSNGSDSVEFGVGLNLPTQTGNNIMVVKVDSYDNAGGIIGDMKHPGSFSSSLNVVFHPSSYVHAFNDNAGGCIGLLETTKTFSSNVTVSDASVTSTDTPFVMAGTPATATDPAHGSNAGGLIGHSIKTCTISGALEFNTEKISVITVTDNCGGCIGAIERSNNNNIIISGTVKTSGKGFVSASGVNNISGATNVGGVIGYCSYSTINGFIVTDMEEIHISGTTNTGGCIGKLDRGTVEVTGVVHFAGSDSVIKGNESTGGCFGLATANRVARGNVYFEGSNNSITGTSDNTGGVFGALIGVEGNYKLGETASIRFLAVDSTIQGVNNTGGIFGLLQSGSSANTISVTFSGKNATIEGYDNVGGIIGKCSDYYHNDSVIQLKPDTSCVISGNDCVGGMMGLFVGDNTNFTNKGGNSEIFLEGDTLSITGKGLVGGIVGKLDNSAHYSGSEIYVSESSTLTIASSEGSAGGLIGYMANMNMGTGTHLTVNCVKSTVSISGKTAAGGLIGINNIGDKSIQAYFHLNADSASSFSITASGENAGAGGLIGINNAEVTRNKDTNGSVYVPEGGSFIIKATNGYAGGLIGVNNGKFHYSNNYVFVINASITGKNGSVTQPHLMVIGLKTGSDYNYKYSIGGTIYDYDYTP